MPYLAGPNAVLEALQGDTRVRRVLVVADQSARRGRILTVLAAAQEAGITIESVPRARLDALDLHHQGILAEVGAYRYTPFADVLDAMRHSPTGVILALDELQDPQNLGTLLRTGLATGVTAVVIPERRSAEITPAVVRSSAGAAERLVVTRVPNLVRALDDLKAAGAWVAGLDAHGGTAFDAVNLAPPLVVVVGSEGTGLRRLVAEHCDLLVHLPMSGAIESLNAAVAGSIVLYHIFRAAGAPALRPIKPTGH